MGMPVAYDLWQKTQIVLVYIYIEMPNKFAGQQMAQLSDCIQFWMDFDVLIKSIRHWIFKLLKLLTFFLLRLKTEIKLKQLGI